MAPYFTEFVECAVVLSDIVLLQPGNGIRIVHSTEWSFRRLEIWIELLDIVAEWWFQHTINNVTHQIFKPIQQLIECDEWAFGLDMAVFGQMATRATCLGTVALCNTEHIAQRRYARFQVQLRALRQICFFTVMTRDINENTILFNDVDCCLNVSIVLTQNISA